MTPTAPPVRVPQPFADIGPRMPNWRPDVILDVGANIGQSAVAYARAFPAATVHSFEPVPEAFRQLTEAARAHPNVTPHHLALGRAAGTLRMRAVGTATGNRVLPAAASPGANVVEVPADTGAGVVGRLGLDRISFLKIDTEGHDLDVLIGFATVLDRVDFVQVEAAMNPHNRSHVPFRALDEFLRYCGFLLFRFYDQALEFKGGGRPVLRRANPVYINASLVDLTGIS